MLAEVRVGVDDLVAPIFVKPGENVTHPIASMPGQLQFSPDTALAAAGRWAAKGIRAVLLFGVVERKDSTGSQAWADDAPVQTLTRLLKAELPELLVITDTCLCEYTDHGHCGLLVETSPGKVDVENDETLTLLGRAAVSQARAGADMVAPSAMMDGQVAAVRQALDTEGFSRTGILGYAVKFASGMYGPFREAAENPPQSGDRRSYQMDYRTAGQVLAEVQADIDEGADIIMVKPAATYLDVIAQVRRQFDAPLAAYHVSGEYAQIKAAAAAGWLDERTAAMEITTAIKRAGADIIITYFAEQIADWLGE